MCCVTVASRMCCVVACESDNMKLSSAKSKSVSLPGDQLIPYYRLLIDFLMIKSITIRNRDGERMQPCLTPVMMSNM